MKYYIIDPAGKKSHNDYKIIKVHLQDEANFLEDYGASVLAQGDSLAEAFVNFEQVKYRQNNSRQ